jgi:hypothetical protein
MIIWRLFKDIEGTASIQLRRKAVALTGLKWRQIYKWIYDRILLARKGADLLEAQSKAAKTTPADCSFTPQVCGQYDFTKTKRVFGIEKVSRC